jgi:predicted PurR-regulated permease PerM
MRVVLMNEKNSDLIRQLIIILFVFIMIIISGTYFINMIDNKLHNDIRLVDDKINKDINIIFDKTNNLSINLPTDFNINSNIPNKISVDGQANLNSDIPDHVNINHSDSNININNDFWSDLIEWIQKHIKI